jgi:hypothetical protein
VFQAGMIAKLGLPKIAGFSFKMAKLISTYVNPALWLYSRGIWVIALQGYLTQFRHGFAPWLLVVRGEHHHKIIKIS